MNPHFQGWVGVLLQVHPGLRSGEGAADFLPLGFYLGWLILGVLNGTLVLEGYPCVQILFRSVDGQRA